MFLYDAKDVPLAKATTKGDGKFEFKDVVAGSYYLYSEKEVTNREVRASVEVKAGATTKAELKLLLK